MPCCATRFRVGLAVLAIVMVGILATATAHAQGQTELGCCQYTARPATGQSGGGQARCTNTTRAECNLLRPSSVFFRRWACDEDIQRCVIGFRTKTPTPTPTPTPTRTATPKRDRVGCCQLDNVDRTGAARCANGIDETSCLTEFEGDPTFCADCSCATDPRPGFEFALGRCVTNTPKPTATPTPAEPRGCCQLNQSRGPHGSICGNEISMSDCLQEFGAGATFCADCTCSSHREPGFDLFPGVCQPRRPTPGPRRPPPRSRRPIH
jgi:hypothetical protein